MSLLTRIKKLEAIAKSREPHQLSWEEGSFSWAMTSKLSEELKAQAREECKTINDVLSFMLKYDNPWEDWEYE